MYPLSTRISNLFVRKRERKPLAVSLVSLLVLQTIFVPLAEAKLLVPSLSPLSRSPKRFSLPSHVGEIVKTHSLSGSSLVHHIQDIHENIAAQTNLSEIVSLYAAESKNTGKKLLVAVEGASGPVDSDKVAALRHDDAKRLVGAGLLRAGILLGEEFAAITHRPGDIKIVGIETKSLYDRNVTARSSSKEARNRVLSTVVETRQQLQKLQSHNFSPVLATLEQTRFDVEQGLVGLTEYLKLLDSIDGATLRTYPQVRHLLSLIHQEAKVDTAAIRRETESLLSSLRDTKVIERLARDAQALKDGSLTPLSYYVSLLSLADRPYPSLQSYIDYLKVVEAVNQDKSLEDLEGAEQEIARKLIKHPVAYELHASLRWIERQEKFFSLNMIPSEWAQQKRTNLGEITAKHAAIRRFVEEQTVDLGYNFRTPLFSASDLKQAVSGAHSFYRLAEARDRELVKNFLAVRRQYPESQYDALLVAGGFHTEGILAGLSQAGLGFNVVRPEMETEVALETPYDFASLKLQYHGTMNSLRPTGGLVAPGSEAIAKVIENPTSGGILPRKSILRNPLGGTTLFALFFSALGSSAFGADAATTANKISSYFPELGTGAFVVTIGVLVLIGALAFLRSPSLEKRRAESADLLDQLSYQEPNARFDDEKAKLSLLKLMKARSMAAALDKELLLTRKGSKIKVKRDYVLVPQRFVRHDRKPDVLPATLYRKFLPAEQNMIIWGGGLSAARERDITPSELNNMDLNWVYLEAMTKKIHDPKFQVRFVAEYADLLKAELGDAFDAERAKQDVAYELEIGARIPALLEKWFQESLIADQRDASIAKMTKLIEFMSAAPASLLSPSVKPYLPPRQNALLAEPEFKKNRVSDEQIMKDIVSGRFVFRMLSGGAARRLGAGEKPAALLTARELAEHYKNEKPEKKAPGVDDITDALPAFADLTWIGRYLLGIRAQITDYAEKVGVPVTTALSNQLIVIPTNSELAKEIAAHVREFNFYGFPPHAIMFVEQRSGPGFWFKDGRFVDRYPGSDQVESGPFGHGDLEFKFGKPNEAYSVERDLDKDGRLKKVAMIAPLHRYVASQNGIYHHNQLSLLSVMTPGWLTDLNRFALAYDAIREGYAGLAEFRVDRSDSKGGMVGYSDAFPADVAEYFGKESGTFVIEASMLKMSQGPEITKKHQSLTANQGMLFVPARELEKVMDPKKYPLIATVRAAGGKRPSVHPDYWSYYYFNLLKWKFFTPDDTFREEWKEPKHLPNKMKYAREADVPSNQTYYRIAAPYQELAKGKAERNAAIKAANARIPERPAAPSKPMRPKKQNISSGGLLATAGVTVLVGLGFGGNLPVLVFAGLLGLLSAIQQYVVRGSMYAGPISSVVSDPRYNRFLTSLVNGFGSYAGVTVGLKPGVFAYSGVDDNSIVLNTALFTKSNHVASLIRFVLIVAALAHEMVHLRIYSGRSRVLNELIAYPVGVVVAPFLAVWLLLKASSLVSLARPEAAEEDSSFLSSKVGLAVNASAHEVQRLRSSVRSVINDRRTADAPADVEVQLDMASLFQEGQSPESFSLQLREAVEYVAQLHAQKSGSLNSMAPRLVLYNTDRSLQSYERDFERLLRRGDFRYEFVSSNQIRGWDGTDAGFISRLAFGADIANSTRPESRFVLSRTAGVGNATFVSVQNIPYAALAMYAYTHHRQAESVLNQLVTLFERFFNTSLRSTLESTIQGHILSAIAA